jgi:hypothetical protein
MHKIDRTATQTSQNAADAALIKAATGGASELDIYTPSNGILKLFSRIAAKLPVPASSTCNLRSNSTLL